MDATMSRVYSVEDIVSNLTKAGSVSNNFPRTDSEQAFQVCCPLTSCLEVYDLRRAPWTLVWTPETAPSGR